VAGLLDFELAGAGFRVQDILAALYNSTALGAPDWPRRTAAFLRGCASVRRLEPPRWRAARAAHRPVARLRPVVGRQVARRAWALRLGTAHVGRLEATTRWLAANGDTFLSVAAAANVGS
jgi:Ser/Thr protein kinase RdoA (MazF antagonist)